MDNGEEIFMGNSSTSKVVGKGKIILKMTSGRELILNDLLYVPDIRKNLVSCSLLSKNGYKLVIEFDKFVLTKNGMYVSVILLLCDKEVAFIYYIVCNFIYFCLVKVYIILQEIYLCLMLYNIELVYYSRFIFIYAYDSLQLSF